MENRDLTQFGRFKDATWFPKVTERIMVGGAGGIGSWITFFLAKAGFFPLLFDFDRVEEHNLGGQLFRQSDVGKLKVEAVARIIREFCGQELETFSQEVNEESMSHHFTISAFDNMRARRDLFNCWKRSLNTCPVEPIFIDGRLLMEQFQILCVTRETADKYEEEYLFADSEVEQENCTLKQTSFASANIASEMMSFFCNHISNIYEREKIRTVPFYTERLLPFSYLKQVR